MPDKLEELKKILSGYRKTIIAFSGGADSAFLLRVAHQIIGDDLTAVTIEAPIFSPEEIKEAVSFAKETGVRHLRLTYNFLSNNALSANTPDRCYLCKKEIFSRIISLAEENNINNIMDGSNYDDLSDYRPGTKALAELGIRSPLREAGFTKNDIREYSRSMGIKTWDKPSMACLASRIPYGERITEEILNMIDESESFLRSLGFKDVRVRHHGKIARIEVPAEDIPRIAEEDTRLRIAGKLKETGFSYTAVDIEGYRTGSLNEVL